jgi:hypothetical protein
MSKKTLAYFSLLMIVIFGITVVVYPLLFNPEIKSKSSPVNQPVTAPPAL